MYKMCQYEKVLREINYMRKNTCIVLSREHFDGMVSRNCDAFVLRNPGNSSFYPLQNVITISIHYLNMEFEGYPLFEAVLEDTIEKWDIFFKGLYSFAEDFPDDY